MIKATINQPASTDYSKLHANTGVGSVSVANSSLNGNGTTVSIYTSALNGSVIRTIVIKATRAITTPGMIRLFIKSGVVYSLIREIPISVFPDLACTPTPPPLLTMLEIDLEDPIQLASGQELIATTQSAQNFNIIAQGVDWDYPAVLPASPSNFIQLVNATSVANVSAANTALDGSGTIATVITASDHLAIESIIITALNSTLEDIVRLFIFNGTAWFLWMEVMIPQSVQANFVPSFKVTLPEDFYLKRAYKIGASTNYGQLYVVTLVGNYWTYPI